PEDGLALCRLAPAAAQARCYAGVAGTLVINTPDLQQREQVCASVDAAHQETCREAAGIRRRTR
ncbi:MAG TPA: hypothetical protein VFS20_02685, partial [Longimicrobium sp.]|nr:hypothetical protein [Longimicrobium sp.]